MSQSSVRRLATILFAIGMVAVAVYVNLPGTDRTIGEISDRYPTHVVPAGYAFSIWSVIFGLSLAYAGFQLLPSRRADVLLERIGWPAASAFLATGVWMIVFQNGWFWMSVLVMIWLLASLLAVVLFSDEHPVSQQFAERILIRMTFGIFLGWIVVATLANVAQVLVASGWASTRPWGIIAVLIAGAAAVTLILMTRVHPAFAVTVAWALIALAINRLTGPGPTRSTLVAAASFLMTAIVLATAFFTFYRRKSRL